MTIKKEPNHQTLTQFSDRVALIVTELNGFRSSLVNEDIIEADFSDDLSELFAKLRVVEQTVSDLGDLFWR